MFAKLKGILDSYAEDSLILDVGGVGYLVHASSRTLGALPSVGESIQLLIETQVREDAITLFGFLKPEEQRWFKLLLSVQGVGARIALALLSTLSPGELIAAVTHQDKAAVARANGVGPKLAQRIVIELKDKVGSLGDDISSVGNAHPTSTGALAGSYQSDAVSALVNLGYRPAEAGVAVSAALSKLGGDIGLDALIRSALKEAAR